MNLFILPFDHRGSFIKGILGVEGRDPTEDEVKKARELKRLIFDGFLKAIDEGVPKGSAGVLVDEWLGKDVIVKAKQDEFIVCTPVEKSGEKEFHFDVDDWQEKIKQWDPDYVKALVRYNPEGDKEMNKRQLERLSQLSDFLKDRDNKFMLELLVPPTEEEREVSDYDNELRPDLAVKAVGEFHSANIYPDVWKIEGMDRTKDMQRVADKITEGDSGAKIIILGRGENKKHAELWVKAGKRVSTAIGFAIGRTVFLEAVEKYAKEEISKEEAVEQVKNNFMHFVDIWTKS